METDTITIRDWNYIDRRSVPTTDTLDQVELPQEIADIVYGCARGSYQSGLLQGYETWSGSSLQGKASSYGARYAESRDNLLSRIDDALPVGYSATTELVLGGSPKRWRRELIIRTPDGAHVW
jgi:hypothetical protein